MPADAGPSGQVPALPEVIDRLEALGARLAEIEKRQPTLANPPNLLM